MLKIVAVPSNILLTPTKPVDDIDESIQRLVAEMEKTLTAQVDPQGVGLAAPQIGKDISLFIIKPSKKAEMKVFINPKILKLVNPLTRKSSSIKNKKRKRQPLEGCLSVSRIWSPVKRAKKVQLEYQTLTGERKTEWFMGFEATIIQHEVDHLNGVLFTQRALEQKNQLYEEKDGKLTKMNY